ncbi:ribosomal protein S7p/S5e, partial [Ancylostoma ceylanicum]
MEKKSTRISVEKVTTCRSTPWCLYGEEGLKTFREYVTTSFAVRKILQELKEENNVVLRLDTFKKALENVAPPVEVRSRRVGGATFQIPTPVRESRKNSLAMKWLIGYARKRNEKTMA